jgi:hypothetical protein
MPIPSLRTANYPSATWELPGSCRRISWAHFGRASDELAPVARKRLPANYRPITGELPAALTATDWVVEEAAGRAVAKRPAETQWVAAINGLQRTAGARELSGSDATDRPASRTRPVGFGHGRPLERSGRLLADFLGVTDAAVESTRTPVRRETHVGLDDALRPSPQQESPSGVKLEPRRR